MEKIRVRKKAKKEEVTFFEDTEWWKEHWQGMPDYTTESKMPKKTLYIHFRNKKDIQEFAKLVGQRIGDRTKSIWWPEKSIDRVKNLIWVDGDEEKKIKIKRKRK